ncbi:hypothetical protein KR032_001136, partial [Drosophila birchii]
RAGHSWCPLLGHIMIDVPGFVNLSAPDEGNQIGSLKVNVGTIVHTHTCWAIINDDNPFIHMGDRM